MDWFDDIQVEELENFDFVDDVSDFFIDKKVDEKTFQSYLDSDTDF